MRSFLCKFFWVGGIHLGNISTCVEMLLSSPKNNNHGGKILFCKLQSLSDVKLDKQVVPGEISLDNQDCKDYPSACTSPKMHMMIVDTYISNFCYYIQKTFLSRPVWTFASDWTNCLVDPQCLKIEIKVQIIQRCQTCEGRSHLCGYVVYEMVCHICEGLPNLWGCYRNCQCLKGFCYVEKEGGQIMRQFYCALITVSRDFLLDPTEKFFWRLGILI